MFGLSLISTKEIELLRSEMKGFYDDIRNNANNEYLKAIAACTRGLELPPFQELDRTKIQQYYRQSAPVQGVVNYIARNVGEVMQYLLLTKKSDDTPVQKHWLIDLLAKPNDRFTLRKFGTAWAINKLLYGDAWVYMHRRQWAATSAKSRICTSFLRGASALNGARTRFSRE